MAVDDSLAELRSHYLDLINRQLPDRAKQVTLPVRFSHCFARIVLDNVFGDCWYQHLSKRQPAYKQLDRSQLERAIDIAQQMLADPALVYRLNDKSLLWRGKQPRSRQASKR